jgi:hypothetical protein
MTMARFSYPRREPGQALPILEKAVAGMSLAESILGTDPSDAKLERAYNSAA